MQEAIIIFLSSFHVLKAVSQGIYGLHSSFKLELKLVCGAFIAFNNAVRAATMVAIFTQT